MKILIVHQELGYFYGGVENHLKEVIKKIILRGHEVLILTERGKEDPLENIKKLKNVRVVYIPSGGLRRSNNFKNISRKVSKNIKNYSFLTGITRLLAHSVWMFKSSCWILFNRRLFEVIWVSKHADTKSLQLLNHLVKIPYVVSLEGYDIIEAKNAKKSRYVFAISNFIKEKCVTDHKFNPEMITIGVDSKKFDQIDKKEIEQIKKKYSSKKEFFVLNVGRLVDSKDMANFVKAAYEVCKKYPSIKFLICGNGPERESLKRLIGKLNLKKNVFLVEGLSDERILQYYKSADIFVHVPRAGNHFGVVYIEAMAAGLPIVAANEDATPDTVGNAALLVKKESPEELSKAIIRLYKNKKLRLTLSKNASLRSKEEFGWDSIIEKMEDLFEKAINNK